MFKKLITLILLTFSISIGFSQNSDSTLIDSTYIFENIDFREELNESYLDIKRSPLQDRDRKKFIGHSFYEIDMKYRVVALLTRTPTARVFKMKTTKTYEHDYVKYGILTFQVYGKSLRLSVYQSVSDRDKNSKFLFLPFKDRTNGHGTYGGGRYLDLQIPQGDSLVIDFNKAYNPYCHYNREYSCPLVPRENHLLVEINAGVKKYEGRLADN